MTKKRYAVLYGSNGKIYHLVRESTYVPGNIRARTICNLPLRLDFDSALMEIPRWRRLCKHCERMTEK